MLKRYAAEADFTSKIENRSSLPALLPHWHNLAERSAEDNVYYAPNYALALLDTVDANKKVHFVTEWHRNVLMALLPIEQSFCIPGVAAGGRAWCNDYISSCFPLLDREHPFEAGDALISALATLNRGEWIFPLLNADGVSAKAVIDALDHRHAPWALRGAFQRASISSDTSFEALMKTHVGSKRRRKMERNRRRLEECGAVSFRTYESGRDLDAAVEDFLRVEASGWKAKRGTALACKPMTAQFARKAFGSGGPYTKSRIDVLLLNKQPIASGAIVFSGNTGFSVKGGYDERYAVWGAGLLLELEIVKSLLAEKWAARIDSATNGPHTIDRLWPDRMAVADLTFSFARNMAPLRLSAHNHFQELKASVKERAKRLIVRS